MTKTIFAKFTIAVLIVAIVFAVYFMFIYEKTQHFTPQSDARFVMYDYADKR